MAKNMNYDIYKPQIIFHPLLSVLYYFFEFSHCFYFHTARIVLYYILCLSHSTSLWLPVQLVNDRERREHRDRDRAGIC